MSSDSSSSDDVEIEAQTSSGTRRSLFPPLWKRFRDQLKNPGDLPDKTGAHVTLDDLAKLWVNCFHCFKFPEHVLKIPVYSELSYD
jgi:hypothetical protein